MNRLFRWISLIVVLALVAGCGAPPTPEAETPTVAPTQASVPTPNAAPEILDFSVSSHQIQDGEAVTLTWLVTGADRVNIAPLGDLPATGNLTINPVADTVYVLTASNSYDSVQSQLEVSVNPVPTTAPTFRVAMLLAQGGMGDKSFNDSGYIGLQNAESQLGVRIHTYDFSGQTETDTMRAVVKENYDLIIALGAENAPAMQTVAAENPNQHFAIVDTTVDAPNVLSVTFRELDGDFLAGALTALLSKENKVAFLGGADTDVIRRIQDGWTQGVRYVNPNATIYSANVGGTNDFAGFNNPQGGLLAAVKLFKDGADVMYVAAGRSGLGGIQAAINTKHLVITSGSDQRYLAPTVVVTSRLKNVNVAVLDIVSDLVKGAFQPGKRELDYKSGGVGLAPTDGGLVPADVQAKFDAIKADLDSGKIVLKYSGE